MLVLHAFNARALSFEVDGLKYTVNSDNTTVTVSGKASSSIVDVVIPEYVNYEGVKYTITDIASRAFSGYNLQSVSIYADIVDGNNGFNSCTVGALYVADNVSKLKGLGINPSAIYCFGDTPPECDANTFTAYNAALHVTVPAMTDFFLADVWSNFNNIKSDAGLQPKSLGLSTTNVTIEKGKTIQLNATVTPDGVVPVNWFSTSTKVVTVNSNGLLTAIAAGEADIVITCMGLREICHVIVNDVQIVATINQHELTLDRGKEATLSATTSPINTAVTWTSTNPGVATVTVSNGKAVVKAIVAGEALIIVTPEGDYVRPDTCHVIVNDIPVVVTIDLHTLKLKRGKTVNLTATTKPIQTDVIWSSTNSDVAMLRVVDGKAMVLANRPGEAMVIASADGNIVQADTCRVTVLRSHGDANSDGITDVEDLNAMINVILEIVPMPEEEDFSYYDLTEDDKIDVEDVNALINIILGLYEQSKLTTYTVNGVSFNMVNVEGGTFTMGATEEQGNDALNNEYPVHQVTLSDFSIGETEVTEELWRAVMGSTPYHYNSDGNLKKPIDAVTWDDCQKFIAKLNQLTGKNFRLPTEAEWEYAARGGKESIGYNYAGSNIIDEVAWYDGVHPVGTKNPNELGLYDMSGNVVEWCKDEYVSYKSDAQTNPLGFGYDISHVYRGGGKYYEYSYSSDGHAESYEDYHSYNSGAKGCRVSSRGYDYDESDLSYTFDYWGRPFGYHITYGGFRLALSQTPTVFTSTAVLDDEGYVDKTYTKTILVSGAALQGAIDITVTNGNEVFSVSSSTILDRALLTITYKPNSLGTHNGTLTLTSEGAQPIIVSLKGKAATDWTPPGPANATIIDVNGVKFKMVPVAGGTFTMGTTSEQYDASDNPDWDEASPHRVTLSDYFIGATEVTQELWQVVMGDNPSWCNGISRETMLNGSIDYGTNLQRPVESVTWNDCQEFIRRLNQLTGKKFRLPTEAEWEFAARGGKKSQGFRYAGSNNVDDVAWWYGIVNDGYVFKMLDDYLDDRHIDYITHTVGTKAPNELGLYDMSGNVNEWCQDRYGRYTSGAQTNPTGPTTGSYRVLRGGSWFNGEPCCRVLCRLKAPEKYTPAECVDCGDDDYYPLSYGLRLVMEADSDDEWTPPGPDDAVTYSVNGVKFKMADVEGGSFTMGATAEQGSDAYSDETPAHQVTLSSYSIGTTEVTQELWQAVMGSNPSFFNGTGSSDSGSSHSANYGTNLHRPVEYVSWDDCQEFIRRLNALTGKAFRLPTEAEWEYAARGGNKNKGFKYAGSNTIDMVAWYSDNAYNVPSVSADYGTHTVGLKAPNELGLYDMSGNVLEWCQDWYGSYSGESQTNPEGPSAGTHHVGRGGCWFAGARSCRVSNRSKSSDKGYQYGLRLVLPK